MSDTPNQSTGLTPEQTDEVYLCVGLYYDWLFGNPDGVDSDTLLQRPHTIEQRKVILTRMDDLNVLARDLKLL